jgi:hypothetical protein
MLFSFFSANKAYALNLELALRLLRSEGLLRSAPQGRLLRSACSARGGVFSEGGAPSQPEQAVLGIYLVH